MGINVDHAYRIAFGLGSGHYRGRRWPYGDLSVVLDPLLASITLHHICLPGWYWAGWALFFLGAFWGGLTVGFVQQCSALVLPPQLQNAAIFVVFLLIVLLRPQGLFGRSAERA